MGSMHTTTPATQSRLSRRGFGRLAALAAGATQLKLFPAEVIGTAGLKAFVSVLPAGTALWPVGGITADSLAGWVRAGAAGFGIGSQLFRPGLPVAEIPAAARDFVAAWRATR